MDETLNTPFIFYLTLEDELPKTFYAYDRAFKELGFMLIPFKIDQLQTLLSSTDQTQVLVIASVTDARELKLYHEKIRGLLKYILKSPRITFMHFSSFSKINDSRLYSLRKNYYFIKYPLDVRQMAKKIARYHDLKSETNVRWPGGRRAGIGTVTV
jgi:hypothetical protein